jgi:hypothetical protein
MLSPVRAALGMTGAILLSGCVDSAPTTGPGARASLAIRPVFSTGASRSSATLSQAGLDFDNVRIVIVRPASDTLKDTTVVFGPNSSEIQLELSVEALPAEALSAGIEYKKGSTVYFSGSTNVTSVAPTLSTKGVTPVSISVSYTGPGANTQKLLLTPGTGVYAASITTQFSATALDGANAAIPNTPIVWSVSDTTAATISATGLLTPKGTRGTLYVKATAANGVVDSASVQLAPAASQLRVVQGAAQTGAANTALPIPVIIEAIASDGLPAPISGTVNFSGGNGSSVTPSTASFDASGRVQATMKLGSTSGSIYLFTATAGGFSVTWGEIALPGTPTQLIANTGTTFSMTAGVAPDPVPNVRVADADGNSVNGVLLKITVDTSGTQVIPPFTVSSDSIGLLEVYKVVPTIATTYHVKIETQSATGITPVLYTVTVNPAAPAKLAFTRQPVDVKVNTAMSPSVAVTVQDQFGNTVTSATGTIAISLDPATGSGVSQTGTGSVSLSGGVATFSNLMFNAVKSGVKIQAIGASLPAILSAAFNITP